MEYANRVIANLNKRLMSMPKRDKGLKMIEVERLGVSMQMAEDKYKEYISWEEERKNNFFRDIIEMTSKPGDPIPVKYNYEGLDFDSKEELLEWKEKAKANIS